MKTTLFLTVLFAAFVSPLLSAPLVEFRDTNLILRDGRKVFKIKDVIDAHADFVTCHAVKKKGQDYFIVYGTSEMSRGWPPRNGRCGAGLETYIRWLHIRDGKIIDKQEGLYQSCFKDRDGWSIEWINGKLHWQTEGFERPDGTKLVNITYFWTYDPQHPEAGITETSKPSDWQPTQ